MKDTRAEQAYRTCAVDDVSCAHKLREAYTPPKQSKFRVASVIRFVRPDGSEGTIKAVNAEPHDANIRGAICAERVALCCFQRDEAACGARVTRVVCVTDAPGPIFPGPCCREFLTATCSQDVEVISSGTKDPTQMSTRKLQELLPLPSVYCRQDQDEMMSMGKRLSSCVQAPTDPKFASAYAAAVAYAKCQTKQKAVFPVLFAAAVCFENGDVGKAAELKGIEYGCSVDAVSLLLSAMIAAREKGNAAPYCILQADQFGVAHAPFASARSLLIEHGFGDVLVCAHTGTGEWTSPVTVKESLPFADFVEIF